MPHYLVDQKDICVIILWISHKSWLWNHDYPFLLEFFTFNLLLAHLQSSEIVILLFMFLVHIPRVASFSSFYDVCRSLVRSQVCIYTWNNSNIWPVMGCAPPTTRCPQLWRIVNWILSVYGKGFGIYAGQSFYLEFLHVRIFGFILIRVHYHIKCNLH